MRFLSVAERELRAATRRPGVYRLRWWAALTWLGLLLWVSWATADFRPGRGLHLFAPLALIAFFAALLMGATSTADSLSRERREGTLGLLFLTNLNAAEIMAGKLLASLLGALYPLLAILPVMTLPVLLGGVSGGQIGRTLLALLASVGFAVVAGLVGSACCARALSAVAVATTLAMCGGIGTLGVAEILQQFAATKALGQHLQLLSPLTTLVEALERTPSAKFWPSLTWVAGQSVVALLGLTWWVTWSWRDRPARRWRWRMISALTGETSPRRRAARRARRQRFLAINPLFWLASRSWLGSGSFMVVTVAVVTVAWFVAVPLLSAVAPVGAMPPLVALLITSVVGTAALHASALGWAAWNAAQRLGEDRQNGSLELILSTPLSERTLARGLWLAFARQMAFPVLTMVLAHGWLLWLGGLVELTESPTRYPADLTPGGFAWHLLFNQPIAGDLPQWQLVLLMRFNVLTLVLLLVAWVTLGWVGRWFSVRLKHPAFAPLAALALVCGSPVLLFALLCYGLDQWGVLSLPEPSRLPLLMATAFGLGLVHCLAVARWAAVRLREDLRPLATGTFARRPRWWLPRGRTVLQWAGTGVVLALCGAVGVLGWYQYQNWRSRRDWTRYQAELRQRGVPLDLAAVWPGPVPDGDNVAQSEAFQAWARRNAETTFRGSVLEVLQAVAQVDLRPVPTPFQWTRWLQQQSLDLAAQCDALAGNPAKPPRFLTAADIAATLAAEAPQLAALAEAVATRPHFRVTTNAGPAAVFSDPPREVAALLHAHLLFTLRAESRLLAGDPDGAAADELTSLRLVQLARQAPDADSSTRAQVLLARSLQPLWEGLVAHRWNEAQLAAFQATLSQMNCLADHTNALRRVVLAKIEQWQPLPDLDPAPRPPGSGEAWQPRGWWFDNCLQLHRASELTIANIDVARGRMNQNQIANDLAGLTLETPLNILFQQVWWASGPARVGYAQTMLHQTITACALERYRLAHGRYPDTLAALVPEFLPRVLADCFYGRPFAYEREAGDRFRLIGFGPNGIKDRGQPGTDDWIWAFPPVSTNAPPQ